MQNLQSFLSGEWQSGSGRHTQLFNPSTGEVLASCSTEGLDLKSALSFARQAGNASLAKMSFAERGTLLVEMSKAIHAQREELIELGQKNAGNTRGDAKFDIDGASHTRKKARRTSYDSSALHQRGRLTLCSTPGP